MKINTRKLITRVGAALMLGLSLFNFGAAWKKSGQDEAFKRTKQIRKKEKEELKPDAKAIVEIAEAEASSVIKEAQEQTTIRQQEVFQGPSTVQTIMKVGIIGTWVISAGLFFSSMIFNYPFALGLSTLSLLPGVPHVATLTLEAQERFVQSDKEAIIQLKLDTNEERALAIKVRITFDYEKIRFVKYEPAEIFDDFSLKKINDNTLDLELKFTDEKELKFENTDVAVLHFQPVVGTGSVNVELDKNESWVYATKENEIKNILGKTENISFRLNSPKTFQTFCYPIGFDPIIDSKENWQSFGMGSLLPNEETKWTSVNNAVAFSCGYDQEQSYLLVSSHDRIIDAISIINGEKEINISRIENIAQWSAEQNNFIVFPLPRQEVEDQQLHVNFFNENGSSIIWPDQGTFFIEFK